MKATVTSKIGDQVTHPTYGIGRITAQYRNGTEWMVRFDNGLRFRRPRSEFDGQSDDDLSPAAPLPLIDREPLPAEQFEARQLLEALRVGVAPASHVRELTIGLKAEREDLVEALAQTHATGGAPAPVPGGAASAPPPSRPPAATFAAGTTRRNSAGTPPSSYSTSAK